MKIAVYISRILVGALFIISGLIKVNDAYGFMYKLEEYFEAGALNMEYMIPYALAIGIFVCIGEILLGVALLVGAMPKLTSILTFIMMVFFTWLTYYTSHCDPHGTKTIIDAMGVEQEIANQCVLACGCFGNAIPLTPIQSFYKDILFLVFLIPFYIAAFTDRIKLNTAREDLIVFTGAIVFTAFFSMQILDWPSMTLFTVLCLFVAGVIKKRMEGMKAEYAIAVAVLIISGVFQYWTLAHLPFKDYRPYAVGESIRENMKSAEELGLTPPVFATEYTFKNINTGQDSIVLSSDWLRIYKEDWFANNYEAVAWDGAEVKLSDGYEPRIQDFAPMTYEGDEMLSDIVDESGYVFMHISKDLTASDASCQPEMNALAAEADKAGIKFYGITNALYEESEDYRHEYQAAYTFLNCDQIELKIIVRSNPGLVLIKDGVVLEKWSHNDIPEWADLQGEYIN